MCFIKKKRKTGQINDRIHTESMSIQDLNPGMLVPEPTYFTVHHHLFRAYAFIICVQIISSPFNQKGNHLRAYSHKPSQQQVNYTNQITQKIRMNAYIFSFPHHSTRLLNHTVEFPKAVNRQKRVFIVYQYKVPLINFCPFCACPLFYRTHKILNRRK